MEDGLKHTLKLMFIFTLKVYFINKQTLKIKLVLTKIRTLQEFFTYFVYTKKQ